MYNLVGEHSNAGVPLRHLGEHQLVQSMASFKVFTVPSTFLYFSVKSSKLF